MNGIWRHKPTGNRYLVIGLATDSNNVGARVEPQVVYVSIEFDHGSTAWPLHVRGQSEFLERFELEQELP